MTCITNTFKNLTPLLALFALLSFSGCEGSKSRDQVDNTVEELAGKKKLDQIDQMKKDINKAAQQQADRYEKTDESAEEK